jgi:hypothetical protein
MAVTLDSQAPPADAAFSGLAGEIVRALSPHTEAIRGLSPDSPPLPSRVPARSGIRGLSPHCHIQVR